MAITDTSSPASAEAEHVEPTGILAVFRTALEEEMDAARRARRLATSDGAPDAR
jgi:hypothetical protein